ncbi:MAG TPA: TetR/AcrR family transcriptional regulator [Acidimicrobiales bacterium]|jgi:AcrR family transcriptional regulator
MGAARGEAQTPVDGWAGLYLSADAVERDLAAAAVRCVARWGLAKTSLDDIAREAGVSRATAYRVFPGGKERLVETVIRYELGRLFHEAEAALQQAETLDEGLCIGLTMALRQLTEHEALRYLLHHEPEAILPHVAFHRLGPLLEESAELSRPHLARFLPEDQIRPAAELLARLVLSYAFSPSPAVNHRDPSSIRRLVQTYLLPAITAEEHRP